MSKITTIFLIIFASEAKNLMFKLQESPKSEFFLEKHHWPQPKPTRRSWGQLMPTALSFAETESQGFIKPDLISKTVVFQIMDSFGKSNRASTSTIAELNASVDLRIAEAVRASAQFIEKETGALLQKMSQEDREKIDLGKLEEPISLHFGVARISRIDEADYLQILSNGDSEIVVFGLKQRPEEEGFYYELVYRGAAVLSDPDASQRMDSKFQHHKASGPQAIQLPLEKGQIVIAGNKEIFQRLPLSVMTLVVNLFMWDLTFPQSDTPKLILLLEEMVEALTNAAQENEALILDQLHQILLRSGVEGADRRIPSFREYSGKELSLGGKGSLPKSGGRVGQSQSVGGRKLSLTKLLQANRQPTAGIFPIYSIQNLVGYWYPRNEQPFILADEKFSSESGDSPNLKEESGNFSEQSGPEHHPTPDFSRPKPESDPHEFAEMQDENMEEKDRLRQSPRPFDQLQQPSQTPESDKKRNGPIARSHHFGNKARKPNAELQLTGGRVVVPKSEAQELIQAFLGLPLLDLLGVSSLKVTRQGSAWMHSAESLPSSVSIFLQNHFKLQESQLEETHKHFQAHKLMDLLVETAKFFRSEGRYVPPTALLGAALGSVPPIADRMEGRGILVAASMVVDEALGLSPIQTADNFFQSRSAYSKKRNFLMKNLRDQFIQEAATHLNPKQIPEDSQEPIGKHPQKPITPESILQSGPQGPNSFLQNKIRDII